MPRILFFPTFVNQFQADFWQRQTDRRKSSAIRPRVFDDPFTLCLPRTNIAGRTRPVEERNLRKRSRGTRRRKEETILFRIPAGTNHPLLLCQDLSPPRIIRWPKSTDPPVMSCLRLLSFLSFGRLHLRSIASRAKPSFLRLVSRLIETQELSVIRTKLMS